MLIEIIKFLFKKIIGNLPEESKRKLWIAFNSVLDEAIKAAAEGAVQGLKKS